MEMSPFDYYCMTPYEFWCKSNGYQKKLLHDWRIARFVAWVGIAKWGGKLKPEELLSLEGDEEEKGISREEMDDMIELMRERTNHLKSSQNV